jgi:hypothetical protein
VRVRQSDLDAFLEASPDRRLSFGEDDGWRAVRKAARAVTASAREKDRDPLESAIASLAEAAQQIPSERKTDCSLVTRRPTRSAGR